MTNLEYVVFLTRNREAIQIPGNAIGELYMSGFEKVIRRVARNAFARCEIVKHFAIEIFDEGNLLYSPLPTQTLYTTTFERLTRCRDISGVVVKIRGEKAEEYFVDYTELEPGGENVNQKWLLTKDPEMLYISVDASKDCTQYFPKEYTGNKEAVCFRKERFGIGR